MHCFQVINFFLEPVIFCMMGVVYSGSGLKTYVHLNRNLNTTSQIIWPHCSKSYLCADHVILTGRRMMNLVSNFECLFDFFSADIKIRSERNPIHSKLSLLS